MYYLFTIYFYHKISDRAKLFIMYAEIYMLESFIQIQLICN
jgi:hypothetical protein